MIKVNITKQSNYPINSIKLRKKLTKFLTSKGITSDSEVNIALVGEKKMLDVANEYLDEKGKPPHNVLSFVPADNKGDFVYPPDGIVYLGEIIVCFPVAFREAQSERQFIENKVYSLVEHGALHLLGEHHI